MYTDIRGQLVPVVAAFVALGIGIVVGSMLASDQGLLLEQQLLIDDLEEQFIGLRQDNARYRQELRRLSIGLEQRDGLLEVVLPPFAASHLEGLQLAVVDLAGDDLSQQLARDLSAWGAKPFVVKAEHDSRFLSSMGSVGFVLQTFLAVGDLVSEPPLGLSISGELRSPPDAVIMLVDPGLKRAFGTFLTPLVASLRAEDIHVVAAESTASEQTLMDMWAKLNVTTVDNVDTPIGLLTLVLAARGKSGHFGTGPFAERLLPNVDDLLDERSGSTVE